MKMKNAIVYVTLFFITGTAYTQDRALNSFEAAKPELSRLLECRDWLKADSSKEVSFDSLPIAKLKPRRIPGVISKQIYVEAGGTEITYIFPSPVMVYGLPAKGMRLAVVEAVAEQTVLLTIDQASLIAHKVQPALGIKLTLNSTHSYGIEKDGRYILVGKDPITQQSSFTCGVGFLSPEQDRSR